MAGQLRTWQPLDTPGQTHHQRHRTNSKATRRQHRSCDQCRKGKRACDAAIPYETVPNQVDPASDGIEGRGHSSVAVAPSGLCSNCLKTGKQCTFEWLRLTQEAALRPRKRNGIRKQAYKRPDDPVVLSGNPRPGIDVAHPPESPMYSYGSSQEVPPLESFNYSSLSSQNGLDLRGPFSASRDSSLPYAHVNADNWWTPVSETFLITQDLNLDETTIETDYGQSATVEDAPVVSEPYVNITPQSTANSSTTDASVDSQSAKRRHKSRSPTGEDSEVYYPSSSLHYSRRRRSQHESSSSPYEFAPFDNPSPGGLQQRLATSTNRSFLTDGLMRVYHDSMENALSCWLTEKTCPYSIDSQESMTKEWGPNWSNRICKRVYRLDRVSSVLRDRPLTHSEDRAASRALQMTIMAFATQWAQSSNRSASEYSSFMTTEKMPDHVSANFTEKEFGYSQTSEPDLRPATSLPPMEFDRSIQEMFWNQARRALQDTADVESLRVIFAHIIFALTQRPLNVEEHVREMKARSRRSSTLSKDGARPGISDIPPLGFSAHPSASSTISSTSAGVGAGLAELDQVMDVEGPPIFLERALRQIHSNRCRLERIERQRAMQMEEATDRLAFQTGRADPLGVEDRKTFNLLFWLSIMFDTLSAAMNQRPLVVSDEDSDVLHDLQSPQRGPQDDIFGDVPTSYSSLFPKEGDSKLWGNFFLRQKRHQHSQCVVRWPCSYEDAAATLCDAAPIKVLLFRKVTQLQTLLSRRARHEKFEEAIHDALEVYQHWNDTYGRFILDCIANHDNLPPRIQSWYVILAGHWHLAGLLLADVIEAVDQAMMSLESQRHFRKSSLLVSKLRRQNAHAVSDLGRCASPRSDSSFPSAHEFHFAVNKGALLTEPWTMVLIRSFSKAGSIFIDFLRHSGFSEGTRNWVDKDPEMKQATMRCECCIRALWYLGKKSDMAFLAATALTTSLRENTRILAPNSITGLPVADSLNIGLESVGQHTWSDPVIDFTHSEVLPEAFFDDLGSSQGWNTIETFAVSA